MRYSNGLDTTGLAFKIFMIYSINAKNWLSLLNPSNSLKKEYISITPLFISKIILSGGVSQKLKYCGGISR